MAPASAGRAEYLIVARVRRPHGVRGDLAIAVDTDRPGAVFRMGRTLLLGDPRGDPMGRECRIARYRPTPSGAILTLDGVATREDAEVLRGHTLLIPAAEAAPAAADEIHYRDLVGMTARTAELPIGTVTDILPLAGGEMLVIRTGGGREILVPFVKEMVAGFDLETGELTIDPPDGLLEI
ncbi:MAG: ribosome maturation factor RimM [Gemmatimonadota bacterium]